MVKAGGQHVLVCHKDERVVRVLEADAVLERSDEVPKVELDPSGDHRSAAADGAGRSRGLAFFAASVPSMPAIRHRVVSKHDLDLEFDLSPFREGTMFRVMPGSLLSGP